MSSASTRKLSRQLAAGQSLVEFALILVFVAVVVIVIVTLAGSRFNNVLNKLPLPCQLMSQRLTIIIIRSTFCAPPNIP